MEYLPGDKWTLYLWVNSELAKIIVELDEIAVLYLSRLTQSQLEVCIVVGFFLIYFFSLLNT